MWETQKVLLLENHKFYQAQAKTIKGINNSANKATYPYSSQRYYDYNIIYLIMSVELHNF